MILIHYLIRSLVLLGLATSRHVRLDLITYGRVREAMVLQEDREWLLAPLVPPDWRWLNGPGQLHLSVGARSFDGCWHQLGLASLLLLAALLPFCRLLLFHLLHLLLGRHHFLLLLVEVICVVLLVCLICGDDHLLVFTSTNLLDHRVTVLTISARAGAVRSWKHLLIIRVHHLHFIHISALICE